MFDPMLVILIISLIVLILLLVRGPQSTPGRG